MMPDALLDLLNDVIAASRAVGAGVTAEYSQEEAITEFRQMLEEFQTSWTAELLQTKADLDQAQEELEKKTGECEHWQRTVQELAQKYNHSFI